MKNQEKNNVVICPPCGENVGLLTKRGLFNKDVFLTIPNRLCRALPPQVGKLTTHGFTLIELLVVVLIIGILAAIMGTEYKLAVAKSHYAQMMPIVKAVANAEELYYLEHGQYTEDIANLAVNLPKGTEIGTLPWGTKALKLPNDQWLRLTPKEHVPGGNVVATDIKHMCNNYGIILNHSNQNAGKIFCTAHGGTTCNEKFGIKLCKSLGGKEKLAGSNGVYLLP